MVSPGLHTQTAGACIDKTTCHKLPNIHAHCCELYLPVAATCSVEDKVAPC